MWASVDKNGKCLSTHSEREGAILNRGKGRVVPLPEELDPLHVRYYGKRRGWEAYTWPDRRRLPEPSEARKRLYSERIETNEQFSALTGFMLWYVSDPARRSGMPHQLLAEIDELKNKIAQVKAEVPKDVK